MTTVTQALLVPPVTLTATDAMYYTSPAATVTKIGRATFYNADTVPHFISVNLVTGGTSTLANRLIYRSVAPNETYVSPELAGQVLTPGFAIRAVADVASFVNIMVSGILVQ